MTIEIHSPVGTVRRVSASGLASRSPSLAGLRLGLLDNGKPNSRELLERAAALLGERHGTRVALLRRKRNTSLPYDPNDLDEFADGVDLALIGTGD